MKKYLIIILLTYTLSKCGKPTNSLKLEIINNDLISYSENQKKDTINQIRFKITNVSETLYYFNTIIESPPYINGLYESGKVIRIFNNVGKEIKYKDIFLKQFSRSLEFCASEKLRRWSIDLERLGYKEPTSFSYAVGGNTNFFIHPKETIYFEYYLNISDTIPDSDFRLGFADLKNDKKYFATLSLVSDTTNAGKNLPNNVLRTIKANNAKIYKGIITSVNKIPVIIIE